MSQTQHTAATQAAWPLVHSGLGVSALALPVSSQTCTVGVNIIHIVYCQQTLQHLLVLIICLIVTLQHKAGKHYLQLQALQDELHLSKQAGQHSQ